MENTFLWFMGMCGGAPEICCKCVPPASLYPRSPSTFSMSHTKMFYKQFSSWFLCVFVHSFNYLGIKYDNDPPHFFRTIYKLNCFCLSPVYGHVLVSFWPLTTSSSFALCHTCLLFFRVEFGWSMENFNSQLAIFFLSSRQTPGVNLSKAIEYSGYCLLVTTNSILEIITAIFYLSYFYCHNNYF